MSPKIMLLLVVVLLACSGFSTYGVQNWPNMYRVHDDAYPQGSCTVNGKANPGTPKAKSNRLKNRYKLPANGIAEQITWDQFQNLKPPAAANVNEATAKSVNMAANSRYVSFAGWVSKAFSSTGGESCNCGSTKVVACDTHIDVLRNPEDMSEPSKQKIIVETTHRIRILAKQELIFASNLIDPTNWSSSNLHQLEREWVRFKGWLFYDADHHFEDWKSDPENKKTKWGTPADPTKRNWSNWRMTCWEIHPVMSIEILSGKPDVL